MQNTMMYRQPWCWRGDAVIQQLVLEQQTVKCVDGAPQLRDMVSAIIQRDLTTNEPQEQILSRTVFEHTDGCAILYTLSDAAGGVWLYETPTVPAEARLPRAIAIRTLWALGDLAMRAEVEHHPLD